MSRTSNTILAAALIAMAATAGCAENSGGLAQDNGVANVAPPAQETMPPAADSENGDVNAYAPDQITGVNGSGNPGATGPGGPHDSRSGSGWNAGPRSNVGGAHND